MKAKTASQFYRYSSRNRKGGTHPVVFRRREQALTMWWQGATYDEIAMSLDISPDTVRHYIRSGKRRGDIRAAGERRSKRHVMAEVRRMHILDMAKQGRTCGEIAKKLNIGKRLVQMRLKEADNAS